MHHLVNDNKKWKDVVSHEICAPCFYRLNDWIKLTAYHANIRMWFRSLSLNILLGEINVPSNMEVKLWNIFKEMKKLTE